MKHLTLHKRNEAGTTIAAYFFSIDDEKNEATIRETAELEIRLPMFHSRFAQRVASLSVAEARKFYGALLQMGFEKWSETQPEIEPEPEGKEPDNAVVDAV